MKITRRKVLYAIYAVLAVLIIFNQVQKYRHKTMDAEIAQIESGTSVLYALDEICEKLSITLNEAPIQEIDIIMEGMRKQTGNL